MQTSCGEVCLHCLGVSDIPACAAALLVVPSRQWMDDLILFSKTQEAHLLHLDRVIRALQWHTFYAKVSQVLLRALTSSAALSALSASSICNHPLQQLSVEQQPHKAFPTTAFSNKQAVCNPRHPSMHDKALDPLPRLLLSLGESSTPLILSYIAPRTFARRSVIGKFDNVSAQPACRPP